jgi:hypothetical protein
MAGIEGRGIKERKDANRETAGYEHLRKGKGCESNMEAGMVDTIRAFVRSSQGVMIAAIVAKAWIHTTPRKMFQVCCDKRRRVLSLAHLYPLGYHQLNNAPVAQRKAAYDDDDAIYICINTYRQYGLFEYIESFFIITTPIRCPAF